MPKKTRAQKIKELEDLVGKYPDVKAPTPKKKKKKAGIIETIKGAIDRPIKELKAKQKLQGKRKAKHIKTLRELSGQKPLGAKVKAKAKKKRKK